MQSWYYYDLAIPFLILNTKRKTLLSEDYTGWRTPFFPLVLSHCLVLFLCLVLSLCLRPYRDLCLFPCWTLLASTTPRAWSCTQANTLQFKANEAEFFLAARTGNELATFLIVFHHTATGGACPATGHCLPVKWNGRSISDGRHIRVLTPRVATLHWGSGWPSPLTPTVPTKVIVASFYPGAVAAVYSKVV